MFQFYRKPLFISSLIAILAIGGFITIVFWLDIQPNSLLFWLPISVVISLYLAFNIVLYYKRKKSSKINNIETEAEILTDTLKALMNTSGKKPLYIVLGNKSSGKSTFLETSNTIKPLDKKKTVSNDFFTWMESDSAIFLKPNHRLTFQEQSANDDELWQAFIKQLIRSNPRKPFAGCLLFWDIEYLIVHENEQLDYTMNILSSRLEFIVGQISSALPIYILITKIDKLNGFKEFISHSPLKSHIEFLSIPLKEAKGAITEYYLDCFDNIVKTMEQSTLDCSSQCNDFEDKQAIISFPKQFELCKTEIMRLVNQLSQVNRGIYNLDIRELFFTSGLQGGRKYNLLAKSCSNYFNLPMIASEHMQLNETPYFSRFLIESRILPEASYAGENKAYLRTLTRNSYLTLSGCILILFLTGYTLQETLISNINVINNLIDIDTVDNSSSIKQHKLDLNKELSKVITNIEPIYDAWIASNHALDDEFTSLNLSKLDTTTKLAYKRLILEINNKLIPLVEKVYTIQLSQKHNRYNESLALLKAYLMLEQTDKRDIDYLNNQTKNILMTMISNQDNVKKSTIYLTTYFQTDFPPVDINVDLVRSTRRYLLSKSKVDMVYSDILSQAKGIDLGKLDIARTVGFDFDNVFSDRLNKQHININKIYTSTGFSTFYRPQTELLSEKIIADDWVLGLSNNIVPTEQELNIFETKVRKKYADDYISQWRNALSELKIKPYNNIIELTDSIDLISGPSSPLTTVLKQLYTNTKFSPSKEELKLLNSKNELLNKALEATAGIAEETLKPDYLLMGRVEQAFFLINQLQIRETDSSPTPWDEIIRALSQVRTYMKDITDSPNRQMAALSAAKKRMEITESDPLIRLKQIAQKSPEPIRTWLLDIVNQTWAMMLQEATKGVQQLWLSDVYGKFEYIGTNRYPFNREAAEEISLEEFDNFFAKGGILDSFITQHLSAFYDINLWQPKRVNGEYLQLSQALMVQLKNFNTIRDTLIDNTSNSFKVPFSIKIVDLDSSAIRAKIDIAGQVLNYYHGPSKVKELVWPPKSGDFSVNFTIQDITKEGKQHVLSKDGQWALYRLLDDTNITTSEEGGFTSEIKVSGRELKIIIRPATPNNPFTLPELFNFELPKKINNDKNT
ncbi:Type VI secretion protein IcmF [Moritella viscosa]|uniref:type VI secretion system membrane subunit TssM n=1 Tax=Moritella viscosa TaxID=80854 RepID=UPI000922CE03|nr:type VI secretion system membrane subunit TssM [Moritella viscosa]SGZ02964.1 Type VI secretion protein IcmF [Moritella viscosa]